MGMKFETPLCGSEFPWAGMSRGRGPLVRAACCWIQLGLFGVQQEVGGVAGPEQQGLQCGPHIGIPPVLAENVRRVDFAPNELEVNCIGCNCFSREMVRQRMVAFPIDGDSQVAQRCSNAHGLFGGMPCCHEF